MYQRLYKTLQEQKEVRKKERKPDTRQKYVETLYPENPLESK